MLRKQASISQGSLAGKEEVVSAETVVAADSVTASSIVIGSSLNQAEVSMIGSIICFKFPSVISITEVSTVKDSDSVTFVTDVSNQYICSVGDTIHIGGFPTNITDVNGIPVASLQGSFLVAAMFSFFASGTTNITVSCGTTASSQGTASGVTTVMRIDKYRYTDTASSSNNWNTSTRKPTTPSHTNTIAFV